VGGVRDGQRCEVRRKITIANTEHRVLTHEGRGDAQRYVVVSALILLCLGRGLIHLAAVRACPLLFTRVVSFNNRLQLTMR